MKTERAWCFAGIFMVVLVLSIPFYSANALAATVSITANSGQAKIPHYIDANSDVWRVEATITDSPIEVSTSNVKIKLGRVERNFNTCSAGQGGTICEYLSPLTDGVEEQEVAFRVEHTFPSPAGQNSTAGNGDYIRADGTAPKIIVQTPFQNNEGKVSLGLSVTDRVNSGAPFVGLKRIDIIDYDNGNVLLHMGDDFPAEKESYEGRVQLVMSGEGSRKIKVEAEDRLGHISSITSGSFSVDFVKPTIKMDTLQFPQLGEFMGPVIVTSDMTVDIIESSALDDEAAEVKAYSSEVELDGREATRCDLDDAVDNLWHCTWENVEVHPGDVINVKITAKDKWGNAVEAAKGKNLVSDTDPPAISFFGTERIFEGKSFVHNGDNQIILRVSEQGSGITIDGIRGKLDALGKSTYETPNKCNQTQGFFECYWDTSKTFNSDGVIKISLSKFEDKVKNQGVVEEKELFVDTFGPKVEELSVFGVSDDGTEKNYFQSHDRVKLDLTAFEGSGLVILVKVKNLVDNAEINYPESFYTSGLGAGWQVFTESDCEKVEGGKWHCSIETDPVMSGSGNNVDLEVRVQDTSGNEAREWPAVVKNAQQFRQEDLRTTKGYKGIISFNLLGLSEETNPDYWEVDGQPRQLSPLVDLDTVQLAYTSMPLEVKFKPLNSQAQTLDIKLLECKIAEGETAPELARFLQLGGLTPDGAGSPTLKMFLEFAPFDGRTLFNIKPGMNESFVKISAKYSCQFEIYSKVGETAIRAAEIQEAPVAVDFAFSSLGALDENLQQLIEHEQDDVNSGIYGVIGTLANILHWVDYGVQVISLVMTGVEIYDVASTGVQETMETAGIAAGKGGTVAAVAFCLGVGSLESEVDRGLGFLSKITQVLSCRQTPGGWEGYNKWIDGTLSLYNLELGKASGLQAFGAGIEGAPLGAEEKQFRSAHSVQDNIGLSVATLCVPGIIKNLDKLRQIKCRYIVCLQQEVPAGLATVDTCSSLKSRMLCKYWMGELFYLIPFADFLSRAGNALKAAFNDPIAFLHTANILLCSTTGCTKGVSGAYTLTSICRNTYFAWKVIDFAENIAGFIVTVKNDLQSGGLQYCDMVQKEEKAPEAVSQTVSGGEVERAAT